MKIAKARSPLRLGLAGGGTDVSPYCDIFGGKVVNATIDRYTYATTSISTTQTSTLTSFDQKVSLEVEFRENLNDVSVNNSVLLHFETVKYFQKKYLDSEKTDLNVETWSEAPRGSGLGGSSSIVVAILSSLASLFEISLTPSDIALDAVIVERIICGFDGGKQDHYASAFGGLNFMTFEKSNFTDVKPISVSQNFLLELESRILLFDTGISRVSADIISNQSRGVQKEDLSVINAMHGMKDEAVKMYQAMETESFDSFNSALENGRRFKRATSKMVETSRLQEILEVAISAGATTGKVSGAGGGGFAMLLVDLSKRAKVIEALIPYSGTVSNCHFTFQGVETW